VPILKKVVTTTDVEIPGAFSNSLIIKILANGIHCEGEGSYTSKAVQKYIIRIGEI
jgi:hypothetical protein